MPPRPRRRIGTMIATASLAVGALGVASVRAGPMPELPAIAADRLLASSLEALASPLSVSGDVRTFVDVGIPELPGAVGGGIGGSALSLLAGEQRYRVWRSPDGLRVAHVLDLGEQDLVMGSKDAWLWDSSTMEAIHVTSPGDEGTMPWSPPDPIAIARRVLAAATPYADVSVDQTSTVAGRSTYELVLVPRSTVTLIGRIAIAIDAGTRLPLRFQVFARGATRASIDAGFTAVSFAPIDPSMFAFTPPPGATVREVAGPAHPSATGGVPAPSHLRLFGSGFETGVAVRLDAPLPAVVRQLLPYSGPLVSAIEVDRGGRTWLLVGPVSAATLERDAASLP